MNIKSITIIIALILLYAAPSFPAGEKPDVRNVRWGMSREEVKKHENAEIVLDKEDMLVYRIEGGTSTEVIKEGSEEFKNGMRDARIIFEEELPDYDLVYLFLDGKLSMAVLHMNDPLAQPGDYIDEFGTKADKIYEETKKEPSGEAKYGENETEDTVYEHPEGICTGRYGLRYIWPRINDRTSIMIELDSRKADKDKSECTLSIFYESLKFPVDPASSAKMHESL